MKSEKVFEILGEGGGICISRQQNELGEKFIYHHNEFDPTDEGLEINNKDEYENFEQPFQLINNKYPWYLLHLEVVHDDYRSYIIERLIEKLNEKSVSPDDLQYSLHKLEEILQIKLNYSNNEHSNKLNWSWEKIH